MMASDITVIDSDKVRQYALLRIAQIFNRSVVSIQMENKFGTDLDASFVSDFKMNELDRIGYDMRDVADKPIMKKIESGEIIIRTVSDYCDYMVGQYKVNPSGVAELLSINSTGLSGQL